MNQLTNKKPLHLDEDEEDILSALGTNQHLSYFTSTQTSKCLKFHLDENIREPRYYRSILNEMDNLNEGDIVRIIIDTHGGRLDSSIQIINAIQTTEATVYVDVVGTAASAGSLIALAAPHLSISPYTTMMIHHASHGTYGSASNVAAYSAFVDNQAKKLMKDVYEGFLTEAEMQDVFTGKEMWMDSDEVMHRLEKRSIYHEKLVKAAAKAKVGNKPKVKDAKDMLPAFEGDIIALDAANFGTLNPESKSAIAPASKKRK